MSCLPPGPVGPVWHEDAHLLVVEKPAGLLAVPGRGTDKQDCLSARVRCRWPDALVVHRLDMATSGLMLFARGLDAQRQLNEAFARRRVEKRYVAIVQGLVEADQGEIDAPIAADWPRRPRQRIDTQHGRPALTRWVVLGRDPEARRTRVELQPVTGRAHQLRVHLQSLGHAIVGDALYGEGSADDAQTTATAQPDEARSPFNAQARRPQPRLLLHATHLSFAHPRGGRPLTFQSPAPF